MLNNMQIVFGVCKAGNGHGFSVPQSGTMLGERAAHEQPTARMWDC